MSEFAPNLTMEQLNATPGNSNALWYESQALLSQDRHIDFQLIKLAKKRGAPGWHARRINWRELQPYLSANYGQLEQELRVKSEDSKLDAKAEIELATAKEKLKALKRENKIADNTYISKQVYTDTMRRLLSHLFSEIERCLIHDLISKYELIIKDINKSESEKINALKELNTRQVENLFINLKNEQNRVEQL